MKLLTVLLLAVTVLAGLLASACQTVKAPIEDRVWVLASYTDPGNARHGAVAGTEVTAFFDSAKGTVSGSGGCNSYGADYTVDKLTLRIGNLFATERACVEPERNRQESDFFNALGQAESYRVGPGTLTIEGGGWTLEFTEQTAA